MLRAYIYVLVLAVICQCAIGQLDDGERSGEWTAANMPNPNQDDQACRLNEKHGFICDPDGLLSPRHLEIINWLLRGFYDNDTACPCSTYWCEKLKKGTHLSVALMKKMKVPDSFDNPDTSIMQAVSHFGLEIQQENWKFGTCNNTMTIIYSQDDGVLFISYGRTTGRLIDREVIEHIQMMYGYEFRPDGNLFDGLANIIVDLRSSLNGNYYYDPRNPQQLVGGGNCVKSGFIVAILIALISVLL